MVARASFRREAAVLALAGCGVAAMSASVACSSSSESRSRREHLPSALSHEIALPPGPPTTANPAWLVDVNVPGYHCLGVRVSACAVMTSNNCAIGNMPNGNLRPTSVSRWDTTVTPATADTHAVATTVQPPRAKQFSWALEQLNASQYPQKSHDWTLYNTILDTTYDVAVLVLAAPWTAPSYATLGNPPPPVGGCVPPPPKTAVS